jgi:hypothetical protein
MARKDLAGILLEEKILGARDLEKLQRSASGRPFWLVLIEAELSTEEELFFLLAQRWTVATDAVLDKVDVPESAKRVWSRDEALAHGLLPVELETSRATVIMVDPSDENSLREFLGRLSLNEARVLLARRTLLERAINRTMAGDLDRTPQGGSKAPLSAEATAQVKVPTAGKIGRPPLTKSGDPKIQPPRARSKTEPKVQIDPELAEEMQRLPARALEADSLTPLPRALRRRRATAPESAVPEQKPFTLEDALRAEERLSRALLQAVEVLSRELEARVGAPDRQLVSAEMARLSRRVARKLGLDRRSADEIGAAAYLFAVDRRLREVPDSETRAMDWFGDLGWAAANEEGLLPVLRALTANAAGFSRTSSAPPLGARIITVVDDYLQLGAASGEIDLGTVSQLLRASPAGAPVVDALLRVLESERVTDPTPATTVTAQSVLHPPAPDEKPAEKPTPEPLSDDKTQRKPAPTAPPPARMRREKE